MGKFDRIYQMKREIIIGAVAVVVVVLALGGYLCWQNMSNTLAVNTASIQTQTSAANTQLSANSAPQGSQTGTPPAGLPKQQ
jgi:type VI protein secretion system component VasK